MSEIESQASPSTIGRKRAETDAQRQALAQYGPADIEAVRQLVEQLPGAEAKRGSEVVRVTAARARAFFKVGAQ